MTAGNSSGWGRTLKAGVGIVVAILVATSLLGGSERAEFALRVLLQFAIAAYGASEGYRCRYRAVPMLAATLVTIGGCYGWYLVWIGDEAFTNPLYLGLVGSGLLAVQVRSDR